MSNKLELEEGDRVIITRWGRYQDQEGEIIRINYNPIFAITRNFTVKLKSGEEEDFGEAYLELSAKKPSRNEVLEAITQIKEQVDKISTIPKREKEELPNHLEYFKKDIQSSNELDRQLALPNFEYVDKTLAAIRKTDKSANIWEEIESKLNKIRWWIKTSM